MDLREGYKQQTRIKRLTTENTEYGEAEAEILLLFSVASVLSVVQPINLISTTKYTKVFK
jgi:hypothetical protein